jgi:hypothetical protein
MFVGTANCTLRTHSKGLLPIAVFETALFAVLIIYDHVLEFIIRGEKCTFVGSCTIQVRIRNALPVRYFSRMQMSRIM